MTQRTPRWVGYRRSAAIRFLDGLGAIVLMLEGEVRVKSGRGRVVANLTGQSTSLLRRMSICCSASCASDSWRWPGILRTAIYLHWIMWAAISRRSMCDASRWGLWVSWSTTASLSNVMVEPGEGGGGGLNCNAQAHQVRPLGGLWAMDARNELESSARDSEAHPWSPMGIGKYWLHNQIATMAMLFPLRWWLAFGINFKPRHLSLGVPV